MTFFQNTLRIQGRILWHIPIMTDGFISITGHCRRRYTHFTQLCICPRNTLKIHGRVLWPKPVTTHNFIINTGHCRRLYTRFTLLCETPQNTLKIHGRVLRHIGHDPRLYIRIPLLLGRRSTEVGIWSNTHGRALPTVRILVPSSRRVSVWPNAITQSISAWYMIVWYLFT